MAKSLAELYQFLDGLQQRVALNELRNELAELDVSLEELAGHVRFADRTYRRNLIRSGPWYNVLILCWKSGQRSPIHDHRGSSCGVRVLDGTMTETLFEFAATGQVKALFSRDLRPGDVTASQDDDLHQVSNLQPDAAPLVTLHVYSPPLLVMGTYSLTTDFRGEEPMFLEFYDAAGI